MNTRVIQSQAYCGKHNTAHPVHTECGGCVIDRQSMPGPGPVIWVATPEGDHGPALAHNEGTKHDGGKPRMDLLDPYAMGQLAEVLSFGATKYAAHNWRKGLVKSRLLAAALRHLFAYLGGQDKDPETGLSHAAHAMCCCMFLLGLEHRPELDDRWKAPAEETAP